MNLLKTNNRCPGRQGDQPSQYQVDYSNSMVFRDTVVMSYIDMILSLSRAIVHNVSETKLTLNGKKASRRAISRLALDDLGLVVGCVEQKTIGAPETQ